MRTRLTILCKSCTDSGRNHSLVAKVVDDPRGTIIIFRADDSNRDRGTRSRVSQTAQPLMEGASCYPHCGCNWWQVDHGRVIEAIRSGTRKLRLAPTSRPVP